MTNPNEKHLKLHTYTLIEQQRFLSQRLYLQEKCYNTSRTAVPFKELK